MKSITLCFQIHHPFHFQTFRFLEIGGSKSYYDDLRIEREINEAAINYYLPTNEFLLKLLNKSKGKLKLAFYISGTALDQLLMYEPEVLTSFRQLADTGNVEFLGGTASHSLVSLANQEIEFQRQLNDSQTRIESILGKRPLVFANTDLIYTDLIGVNVANSGYKAMITNGPRKTLMWRSPNYVYSNAYKPSMHIYCRNEQLSDELAANLGRLNSDIDEVNENGFIALINNLNKEEPLLNIYLDYRALGGFGINKKQKYFQKLVGQIIRRNDLEFVLTSEIMNLCGPVAEINAEEPICWLNSTHSSYYPGNDLQKEAINQVYILKKKVAKSGNLNLQKDWQYLQTSDHFHLMDNQHPAYNLNNNSYSIYRSNYEAFINYMNILEDFRFRLKEADKKRRKTKETHEFDNFRKQALVNHSPRDLQLRRKKTIREIDFKKG